MKVLTKDFKIPKTGTNGYLSLGLSVSRDEVVEALALALSDGETIASKGDAMHVVLTATLNGDVHSGFTERYREDESGDVVPLDAKHTQKAKRLVEKYFDF